MNRTFLSLYAIIVIVVVLSGWGLDLLWKYFAPPPVITNTQRDLIQLISYLHKNDLPYPNELASQITELHQEDLARSSLHDQLITGQTVLLHDAKGNQQLYKLVPQSNTILRINIPKPPTPTSHLDNLLLSLFYIAIGIGIFIWVWPLMRDVKKLEAHTRHVGKHTLPDPVNVLPGSAVSNLAQAFNQMAERIKELLASHKEMTYAVSHELRTPLARMKFALAMLDDSSANNPHTQSLQQDIAEMDELITQLLSYAGYEHESEALKQEKGDMSYLIHELIKRAEDSSPHIKLNIHFECAINPPIVDCEWHLMERALFNIIHNGFRFANNEIRIRLISTEACFQINIEDDGPGIPQEDHARVFDSFVRLEGKANSQVRGFGLGLAIVKRILRWHNGDASVSHSSLGGANFELAWPKPKS